MPELQPVLNTFDLEQFSGGQINRAHGVLTFQPWRGGCSVCCLNKGHEDTSARVCSRQKISVHNLI
jgi:hypothetical protein